MTSLSGLMNIHIFAKIFSSQVKKLYCQNNDSKNTNGFISKTKGTVLKVNSLFFIFHTLIVFLTKKPPGNDGR